MVDVITDLHLHSPYSRAVSPQMTLSNIARVAKQKGLDVLATGDWTHPVWFQELQRQLVEVNEGIYRLKSQKKDPSATQEDNREVYFLLSVEIATIFTQNGKGRRIHNLVFVPSLEVAEKVNKELLKRGCNLASDGRPIIGLSSKHLLELLLEIDERILLIPAHAWTPWFGIYGQMSGFNSLREAFEDLAPYVYGIETGLSSDPEMNWRMQELDTRSILSFSDAHSLPKMGREATVFRLENLSYDRIRKAIMQPAGMHSKKHENRVLHTIEFFPEEGKYHYSGHRKCGISQTPEEQQASGDICPVCKRKVTDGVMRRVQELSQEVLEGSLEQNASGVVWIHDPRRMHPPFVKLVPLLEIVAEALGVSIASSKAKVVFDRLCSGLGSELCVLLESSLADIEAAARFATTPVLAKKVAQGIGSVRAAKIVITPGYDGVYGVVKIRQEGRDVAKDIDEPEKNTKQIGLEF